MAIISSAIQEFFGNKSKSTAEETKGKWVLRKGVRTENMLSSNINEVAFVVNPQRVTVTPKLRVSIENTLDGRAISPWVDPESGTNIGSIEIRMDGNKPIYYETDRGMDNLYALTYLYNMSLDSYLKEKDNVLVQEVWQLIFSTPVFSNRTGGGAAFLSVGDMIALLGYMTQPMTITESADTPWYPSWSMTFSIFGGDIKKFRESIAPGAAAGT